MELISTTAILVYWNPDPEAVVVFLVVTSKSVVGLANITNVNTKEIPLLGVF